VNSVGISIYRAPSTGTKCERVAVNDHSVFAFMYLLTVDTLPVIERA